MPNIFNILNLSKFLIDFSHLIKFLIILNIEDILIILLLLSLSNLIFLFKNII